MATFRLTTKPYTDELHTEADTWDQAVANFRAALDLDTFGWWAVELTTPSRLIFWDLKHLIETRAFADRTGQRAQLDDILKRVENLAERCGANCFLSPDFVPHSWYWQLYPDTFRAVPSDWERHRIMNGGLIYHGALEDGTHPETFTVSLTPVENWSIHT